MKCRWLTLLMSFHPYRLHSILEKNYCGLSCFPLKLLGNNKWIKIKMKDSKLLKWVNHHQRNKAKSDVKCAHARTRTKHVEPPDTLSWHPQIWPTTNQPIICFPTTNSPAGHFLLSLCRGQWLQEGKATSSQLGWSFQWKAVAVGGEVLLPLPSHLLLMGSIMPSFLLPVCLMPPPPQDGSHSSNPFKTAGESQHALACLSLFSPVGPSRYKHP